MSYFVLQNSTKTISVSRCESLKIRLFFRKLSSRKVCGERNTGLRTIYSAELQTTKQTLATSKHSIEFTYSDFPCHLKVNRDKLALSNRRWKCKKEGNWLPVVHSRKWFTNTTISPALFPAVTVTVIRDRKIRTVLRTNQIAGFVTVPSWKKNIYYLPFGDIKEHTEPRRGRFDTYFKN